MSTSWEIEAEIDQVERSLHRIKDELAGWSDAATNLTLAAADRRAKNAELGRGLGGVLFGAKYRAAARRSAASDNAAASREVAGKRRSIAAAKQGLRETERELRWRLRDLKSDLRDARAREREEDRRARLVSSVAPSAERAVNGRSHQSALTQAAPAPVQMSGIREELRRLKASHANGELDAAAYEQARITLLTPHLDS